MGKRDEALSLARDFERDGFSMPNLYERFWRLQGDAAAYFTLADSLLRGRQMGVQRSRAKARHRRERMRARTNARAKAHGNAAEMKKARAGKTLKRSSQRQVSSSRRFCTRILASFLNCGRTRARITRSIRGAGLVTRAQSSGARSLRIRRRAETISKKFLAACCKPAIRET